MPQETTIEFLEWSSAMEGPKSNSGQNRPSFERMEETMEEWTDVTLEEAIKIVGEAVQRKIAELNTAEKLDRVSDISVLWSRLYIQMGWWKEPWVGSHQRPIYPPYADDVYFEDLMGEDTSREEP
jgi:hypothetical protein